MKRLTVTGFLCVLAALALAAAASAQTGREACEEIELAVKASFEGTNIGPDRAAAEATKAAAGCWAELRDVEAAEARVDQEIREAEEREAARKAQREEERRDEQRERAAAIRRERHHICMEVAGDCWIRPHEMPYGAHASIYGIHWRSWGPHRAIGIGHILWRHTVSEPHFGPYRAKLVLSLPAECDGATWYSQRTLTIKRNDVIERDEASGPCAI